MNDLLSYLSHDPAKRVATLKKESAASAEMLSAYGRLARSAAVHPDSTGWLAPRRRAAAEREAAKLWKAYAPSALEDIDLKRRIPAPHINRLLVWRSDTSFWAGPVSVALDAAVKALQHEYDMPSCTTQLVAMRTVSDCGPGALALFRALDVDTKPQGLSLRGLPEVLRTIVVGMMGSWVAHWPLSERDASLAHLGL